MKNLATLFQDSLRPNSPNPLPCRDPLADNDERQLDAARQLPLHSLRLEHALDGSHLEVKDLLNLAGADSVPVSTIEILDLEQVGWHRQVLQIFWEKEHLVQKKFQRSTKPLFTLVCRST
jgi:hypothetical protein